MEKGCVDVVLGLREMIGGWSKGVDCLLLSDKYKVPRGLRDDKGRGAAVILCLRTTPKLIVIPRPPRDLVFAI
jgi:hypothetical protein